MKARRNIYWTYILSVCIAIIFLCSSINVYSQEYTYTNYTIKEGLAGSIVYSAVQDKDGFLWFGTETGLSRFDGSKFVNFTTIDGLPDNEVLNLFADSKGRVWIMPFRISLCYYYKGRIYTKENDSVLRKLNLTNNVFNIAEDKEGNILLQEDGHFVHEVRLDGTVLTYPKVDDKLLGISQHPEKGFWVKTAESVLWLKEGVLKKQFLNKGFSLHPLHNPISPTHHITRIAYGKSILVSLQDGSLTDSLTFEPDVVHSSFIGDSLFYVGRRDWIDVFDINDNLSKRVFVLNAPVQCMFIDSENNRWFCTGGKGVFRLNSQQIKTRKFVRQMGEELGVQVIFNDGPHFILGAERNRIFFLEFDGDKMIEKTSLNLFGPIDSKTTVLSIVGLRNQRILYGSGDFFCYLSKDLNPIKFRLQMAAKHLLMESDSIVLIGTSAVIERFNLIKFAVEEVIWEKRPTCLLKVNDTLYVGGLDGIVRLTDHYRKIENLGNKVPELKNRISAIKQGMDGKLWVALYGGGIIVLEGEKLAKHLTIANGLVSNVCKTMHIEGRNTWLGTDKGLTKITEIENRFNITNYTTADGLPAESINSIVVYDSTVFLASQAGLTYFKEQDITQESICLLRITNIDVNNSYFSFDSTNFILRNDQNSIQFGFVGISFKSSGDISYRYRLRGLSDEWQTTRITQLNYPSLASGSYTLEIQAINKFGKRSDVRSVTFFIEKHFTEKAWFRILAFFGLLALVALIVKIITGRIKRREKEKTGFRARINELEQLALRSQMNPHFIFNSLNSIQQYVVDKDVAGANKFITEFARLIRQTLEFSSKSLIQLQDELDYLETYLKLEKQRLENKFDYKINVQLNERDIEGFHLPPMILQPYVENCIRHGIRYRHDKLGLIKIDVINDNNELVCVIEDNGVGRKYAGYHKSINPIEYQSKGMSLTADRLDLINRNLKSKLSVVIEDLVTNDLQPAGTRVVLRFPADLYLS